MVASIISSQTEPLKSPFDDDARSDDCLSSALDDVLLIFTREREREREGERKYNDTLTQLYFRQVSFHCDFKCIPSHDKISTLYSASALAMRRLNIISKSVHII